MVTKTCRCGKTRMTFQHLTEKDFGKETWISDCCLLEDITIVKDFQEVLEVVKECEEVQALVEVIKAVTEEEEDPKILVSYTGTEIKKTKKQRKAERKLEKSKD